ncbi:MAG: transglycosylase domain-containing protein [Clostridia bacterium]|nr:transglycosylase domain-containing protein [Clostridia bacterium]
MRKALKIFLVITIVNVALILTALTSFFVITAGTNLQPEKLVDYDKTIAVFDDQDEKIEDTSLQTKKQSVKIDNLKDDTVNAFIASEDRSFYKHNGLNYKRMVKALYKNVISRSFKEGASTISQQLIKNTHLNNDKTITRKLKEIKLTKQLERKYSKDQILEMYLNTIYFGHNCFGLQSAANFYFDKSAEDLTLEQSATIVGLLTSPNNFSPFKNPQKCLARRNTVLRNMTECGFIDEQSCENAIALPLSAIQNGNKERNSGYLNAVFNEFEELDIDPYGQFGELHIKTYLNSKTQKLLDEIEVSSDYSYFVRTQNGGVAAFKSSIGSAKRQIGSTAKPIFVYAPALEERKLNLFTKINDEPIDYGGYTPENYDKKYHGRVTVAESIKQSLNIPAVKTLNSLNLDDVEKYADKMNIKLKKEDKTLALALGGMSEGLTLKELCDAYSVFANHGDYASSHFIKEICDQSGKILYQNKLLKQNVFSEGTCSLINDVLCETAKSGTAKKLSDFEFDVACKTGTCGNRDGNTDAYSVAYTSDYCIGVWFGDKDNKKLQITGGKDCCNIASRLLSEIYSDKSCTPLDKSTGTVNIEIDREEYEKNDKILLSDENAPQLNRLTVKCLQGNDNYEQTTRFTSPTIKKPSILVNNNQISISLCQTKYYSYIVKRQINNKTDIIYDGQWKENIVDQPGDGEYIYTVTPYFVSNGNKFTGVEITLPRVIIRAEKSQDKVPDIAYKDWFNK